MKDTSTSTAGPVTVISITCDRIEIQQSGRSERKILDRSDSSTSTDVAIMGNEVYIGASKYRIKGKEIQQIHHATTTTMRDDDDRNNCMNRGRGTAGTSARGGQYRYAIRIDTLKNDMTFHLLSSFTTGSDATEKKVWDRFIHRLQTLFNKYQRLLPDTSSSSQQQPQRTSINIGPRYTGSAVGKNNNNHNFDRSKPLQQHQRHPKRGVFGSQNVLLRKKQQERHRKSLLPETYETFSSDDDGDNNDKGSPLGREENELAAESTNDTSHNHETTTGRMDDDEDDETDHTNHLLDDKDSHDNHPIPTITERKPRKVLKVGKRLFKSSNKNAMGSKTHIDDDSDRAVESDDDDIFNTITVHHDSSSAITTPSICTQRLVSPHTTTTTASTSITKTNTESLDDDDNDQDKTSEDKSEKTQKQQPSINSFFQPRTYKKQSLSSSATTDRSTLVSSSTATATTPTRTRTMTPTSSSRRVPTTFVRNSGSRTILPSKTHSSNNYTVDGDDDENTNWLLQSPVRKLRSPQEKRRYELFGTMTSTTKKGVAATTTTQESIDISSSSSLSSTDRLLLSPGDRISLKNISNDIHNNNNNISSNRINRLIQEDDPIEEYNSPRLLRTTASNSNRSFSNNVNNNSNVNNSTTSSYRPLNFANITKRRRIAPTPLLNPFANSSSTPKGLLDFQQSESAIRTRTTTSITDNNSDGASSSTTLYTPTPGAIYRKFRGLRNLGNTCYQNASLQMLYSCRHFMRMLQDLNGNGTNTTTGTVGPITNCISTLGQDLMKHYLPPVNPRLLKDAMDAKTDKYIGYEQRDAHEFVSDLIDYVHEELEVRQKKNSGATVPATNTTATLDQQSEPSGYLPTNDFCMNVQVGLKCCSCGYTRNKEEMYRHLSIDIVTDEDVSSKVQQQESSSAEANDSPVAVISIATVERSIQHFFQPEIREIKCEKCAAGTHAEQTLQIVSRPKLLLLHLKRFIVMERKIYQPAVTDIDVENHPPNIDRAGSPNTHGQEPTIDSTPYRIEYIFKKNKAPVVIPEFLSLDEYHQASSNSNEKTMDTQERSYKLQSIVHHIGSRASSGHYTTDAIRDAPPLEVISTETTPNPNLDEANKSSEETTTKHNKLPPSQVWVSYDDGVTNETSTVKILGNKFKQSTAYMLLYSCEQ